MNQQPSARSGDHPETANVFFRWFPYLLLCAAVLNATGLGNAILEPDGALYATIAKYMVVKSDWVNLYGDGHEWLDKPHFPFWMAAIGYSLLGMTSFAYKFAAFLFWLVGLRFTFLLAKALYNPLVARMATLIQALALHNVLSNFDVRAEPYLTMLCTGAIYYFYRSYLTGRWHYLLLTALLTGCAIMTKGIFVLLTIGGGFVVYWIATRQWKQFIHYRWYVLLLLTGSCMLPELYCLYVQFDQHPEKVVFGRTGVSGIRFFLWDSQFGRFFNTGPIKGKGDPSFFLHTTLWAFLPWALYLYVAVCRLIGKRTRLTHPAQWIILGSAGLSFLLFSLSSFQLPHYIVILFPQFAMITAGYLVRLQSARTWKRLILTQNLLVLIAAALVIFLVLFSGIGYSIWVFLITAVLLVISFRVSGSHPLTAFFVKGTAFTAILFLFLNVFFYPKLMLYQSGMMAGKWLSRHQDTTRTGMYGQYHYSLEFYAPGSVHYLRSAGAAEAFIRQPGPCYLYTTPALLRELQPDWQADVVQSFPYYHITLLKGKFLNPATRQQTLDTVLLVRMP